MARGQIRPNGAGRVDRAAFTNKEGQQLPFHEGRLAASMSILPLPSSAKTANDFNEGYDFQESIQGVPLENRNTYPKGQ